MKIKGNSKKGLSIIVLVVFSIVIVMMAVTIGMNILNFVDVARKNKLDSVNEQNAYYNLPVNDETKIDFSACYFVEEGVGVIKITDNSSNIVMFTCMKMYDEVTPNVSEAEWEYTNTFVVPDSGEYLIYAKDINGNVSDAVVVNVEI